MKNPSRLRLRDSRILHVVRCNDVSIELNPRSMSIYVGGIVVNEMDLKKPEVFGVLCRPGDS